jgi:hypothetical protein
MSEADVWETSESPAVDVEALRTSRALLRFDVHMSKI